MENDPHVSDQGVSPSATPGTARSRRALPWVLAALAILALLAAGCFGYRALTRARNAQDALARASAKLESAEGDLLKVDGALQVEISSTVATQAADAARLAEKVRAQAQDASDIIAEALPLLPQKSLPLANALKASADSRVRMMEIAPKILEIDRKAALALAPADVAVTEIKAAEALSARAVVEFNRHTAAGVKASDAFSAQAEARLKAAQAALASAASAYPDADFSAFTNYVGAKIGLIQQAKAIDAAWLSGDVKGSNTKLTAYNKRDAEIVAMAKSLPASVRDPVATAYEAATRDLSKQYFEARAEASKAGELVGQLQSATPASGK